MDVGFFGKLPSHGDFLRRRASDDFVRVWDAWLQQCLGATRELLGDRWLDLYLTSPAWRFACAAGASGAAPVVGIMVPSVDRVGRYFPLTVVADVPPDTDLLLLAADGTPFFGAAEDLVIETLDAEHVDFERFDARVRELGDRLHALTRAQPVVLGPAAAGLLDDGPAAPWQMPIAGPERVGAAFTQLLSHRLATRFAPLTLWWTGGSPAVDASLTISQGLVTPRQFAAMLDGAWSRHQWQGVPAQVNRPGTAAGSLDGVRVQFRSAAATEAGRVRTINQDAFVERSEVGLWAVADGLGGHSSGEVASRMVCDALADFTPADSFDDTILAVRARIGEVNEHLLRAASRSLTADRCGSTVVVLLLRGGELAVLWAGDSRAYRWRGGRLEALTTDHSAVAAPQSGGRHETNEITRAVGAEASLTLDVYRDAVGAGDRFLLCSDGLTRTLAETEIAQWLGGADIRAVVDGLISATLDAGAPDNVTVLVVEAREDAAGADRR